MRQGGRAETESADGGGYEGKHGKVLPGTHNITELGNIIEVPGSYHYVIGLCLDEVGWEHA